LFAWYLRDGTINAPENAIENAASSCERWALGCAAVVVLAVVAEIGLAIIHPEYDSPWNRWGTSVADAAIALGIIGEVLFGRIDARYQTELRRRSNDKLGTAERLAAEANQRAAQIDLRRVQLEAALAPRVISKHQYDVLQTLRGKVAAINIAWETDAETASFSSQVAVALQAAGIQVRGYARAPGVHGNANMLFDRHAFHQPDGEPTRGEPIASVFREAGIDCAALIARMPSDIGAPEDIPMIVIGGRPHPVAPSAPSYLGPSSQEPSASA